MALVLIEGFDHDNASNGTDLSVKGWQTVTSVSGPIAGRFSGSSIQLTRANNAGTLVKLLPSTYSTLIGGAAFKFASLTSSSQDIMQFRVGATLAVRLFVNTSAQLSVRNSGGTVIATGTTVLQNGVWYFIELKAFINGASGTCEVHLSGNTEIASTVGNFGSSNIDTLGLVGGSFGSPTVTVDDVYLCDTSGSNNNNFLGDCRVLTFVPDAPGAHTDFSSSGINANWQNVDEEPVTDDTDYNFSSSPGNTDTFGTTAAISLGATVFGVQHVMYPRKDNTGTRTLAPVIRQGGVDYVGSTDTLLSSYQFFTQIYNQDPTNSNWTPTNVNADEFGYQLVA